MGEPAHGEQADALLRTPSVCCSEGCQHFGGEP